MDDGDLSRPIILLALIGVQAVLVLAYNALTNARQHQLRDRADDGSARAAQALTLIDQYTRLTITYQLARLLLHLGIGALTVAFIAPPLAAVGDSPALIYVAVLAVVALVAIFLGDLLPASIGSAYADPLALWAVYPMRPLMTLAWPVTTLMIALDKWFARLLGGGGMSGAVTEEEIITLVDAGQKEGTIDLEEKDMILSILQFDETFAYEVMVPRMDIVAVEIHTPFDEALARFIESGHSRIPVYKENIDNIEGLLYAKDMLTMWHAGVPQPTSIRELLRPAYFVPESKRADLLLKELQTSKIHIAIVVDEYGGTAGLVTVEDLIEEIVGDIQDEYDINEEADYVKVGEDVYLIDAGMNLDDLNDLLDIELTTEDSSTLGGYIYARIGRVPAIGETLLDEDNEIELCIESVEGRRIRKVRITRQSQPDNSGPGDHEQGDAPTDHSRINGMGTGGADLTEQSGASRLGGLFSSLLTLRGPMLRIEPKSLHDLRIDR